MASQSTSDRLPCFLEIDAEARSGADNMRLDAAMLQRVIDDPSASLARIYWWEQPTVSLGHFQSQDADVDSRIAHCPRVKRLTGGGAILHDIEVTYSCALPSCHPVRKDPVQLYELVHSAIIDLLTDFGVHSALRRDSQTSPPGSGVDRAAEPFLCFLRSDPRDIVTQGHKIVGSAQRRRRGNILQHGSVLLSGSKLTPEILGIQELSPRFDTSGFESMLGDSIRRVITV